MAKSWREDVAYAGRLLEEVSDSNSSWLSLMIAEANLKVVREAVDSALTRLNGVKTVIEAKKNLRITTAKEKNNATRT